jgi:Flp pilus assembly pilin Flp
MLALYGRFRQTIAGISALEYSLIAALVAVLITAGMKLAEMGGAAKVNVIATGLQ